FQLTQHPFHSPLWPPAMSDSFETARTVTSCKSATWTLLPARFFANAAPVSYPVVACGYGWFTQLKIIYPSNSSITCKIPHPNSRTRHATVKPGERYDTNTRADRSIQGQWSKIQRSENRGRQGSLLQKRRNAWPDQHHARSPRRRMPGGMESLPQPLHRKIPASRFP